VSRDERTPGRSREAAEGAEPRSCAISASSDDRASPAAVRGAPLPGSSPSGTTPRRAHPRAGRSSPRTCSSRDALFLDYFLPGRWVAALSRTSPSRSDGRYPVCYLVALAAPGTPRATVDGIFRGMARAADPSDAADGGTRAAGDRLVLCLTVVGALFARRPVSRNGARPGTPCTSPAPRLVEPGLSAPAGGRPPNATGGAGRRCGGTFGRRHAGVRRRRRVARCRR